MTVEPVLPGLDRVLVEVAAGLRCDQGPMRALVPVFLRDKGADGVLVACEARYRIGDVDLATLVSVRLADPARLRGEARKLKSGVRDPRLDAPGLVLGPGGRWLAYRFPGDRRLPGLRRLLRLGVVRRGLLESGAVRAPHGSRLRRSGAAFEIASYRPERRAVLRWRIGWAHDAEAGGSTGRPGAVDVHIRTFAQTPPPDIALRRAVARAGVAAPRLLATLDGRTIVEETVPGQPLAEDGSEHARAASTLARLHRAEAAGGRRHRGDDRLRVISRGLAELRPSSAADVAREVVRVLQACRPAEGPPRVVHGDAHAGQFLVSGDETALVDWDRAGWGASEIDLAAFQAHLALADPAGWRGRAEAFATSYEEAGGVLDEAALDWHRAAALVLVSHTPRRRFLEGWRSRTSNLLAEALADAHRARRGLQRTRSAPAPVVRRCAPAPGRES